MLSLFLLSTTSCIVLIPAQHHDNGKHKGWYMSTNDSHNSSQKKVKDNHSQNLNKSKGNSKR